MREILFRGEREDNGIKEDITDLVSKIARRVQKSRYSRLRTAVIEELNRLPLSGKRKYKCYILIMELGFDIAVTLFEHPVDGAHLCIIRDGICHIFFDEKQPFNVAIPKALRQSKTKPLVKLKAMTCEDFCRNQAICSSCPESIGLYHCRLFPDNDWEGRLNKLYRSEDGRFLLTKYKKYTQNGHLK